MYQDTLEDNFSFGVTGSVNKITRFVPERVAQIPDYVVVNPGDLNYYAVDGIVKYSFMNAIKSKVIDPSDARWWRLHLVR